MNKSEALSTAVVVLIIGIATAITYRHVAAQETSVHASIGDTDNIFIETPSHNTRVYKFIDTDGTVCYVAEAGGVSSMQCDIRTPEQTQ